VELNVFVHSKFWHDEFFGLILPKRALENSDPRHIFSAFLVWSLNKKTPKQYLLRSIRVTE